MTEKRQEKEDIYKGENTEKPQSPAKQKEIGGFEKKQEPTRFGDWDVNGRCSDF